MAAGHGPKRSLFILGYAGWGPGQLEQELAAGAWFVVEPDAALLFDSETATKWQRAYDRRGVDL
jgi:putative transcriptional regulator